MQLITATILSNQPISPLAYRLRLHAPEIAAKVQPGQFVHLQIPDRPDLLLRRPFTVFQAHGDEIVVLYKIIGEGTTALATAKPKTQVSLIGPLGSGFAPIPKDKEPVFIAGGYGSAALYLLAARSARQGTIFIGGRSKNDIFAVNDFVNIGWSAIISTEDGSLGQKGLVTTALDQWLNARKPTAINNSDHPTASECVCPSLEKEGSLRMQSPSANLEFYACGPNGMLQAIGQRAIAMGIKAWLAIDRPLGCGIGACLACAQKVHYDNGETTYVRTCHEGPVFECRQLVWENSEQ